MLGLRLGVLGTLVWDRLYAWAGEGRAPEPFEGWGGITYSLAALAAAPTPGWEVLPILKTGADREAGARAFIRELGFSAERLLSVPEPTNHVELRYWQPERRCERLTGGVPPWQWSELQPRLAGLDALYLNFISGYEMELAVLQALRAAFPGPVYTDVHSLLLGRQADGSRVLQPLAEWERWLSCVDVAQLNEEEIVTLTGHADLAAACAAVLAAGPRLVLVTRGGAGALYAEPTADGARLVDVPPPAGAQPGDPTGAGDVWGATCCVRLLAGDAPHAAVLAAHRAAARKLAWRGAQGLWAHLTSD